MSDRHSASSRGLLQRLVWFRMQAPFRGDALRGNDVGSAQKRGQAGEGSLS
eukprot:NODE_2644_length_898_cov_1221.335706.p6 GENE.NODE_2644_length_898_cov_1221.335706~~NODE_2644_length_898_cov_1221.335706.p6  ORF type:complete len:51 (-),score=9.94 NODE_2644_length_898_cov_1221.335706:344-496(-)